MSCGNANGTIAQEESDDEQPLSERFRKAAGAAAAASKRKIEADESDDEDDNVPLAQRKQAALAGANGKAKTSSVKVEAKSPSSSQPSSSKAVKTKTSTSKVSKVKRTLKCDDEDEDGDDKPLRKKAKVEVSDESSSGDAQDEDDEEEEESDSEQDEDDVPIGKRMATRSSSKKVVSRTRKTVITKKSSGQKVWWTTLQHNGVIFPPPYAPHGVKMLYDGKPIDLTPEQEEVATMFAVMKDTDYATKSQFRNNFWEDWKKLLGDDHLIQELERCDFSPIYDWHMQEKEKKKQMTTEEKKRLKEEKAKAEEKYTWAVVDGVKEKVGNFRVEPPGLFRGRGEHPKMGKFKRRIFPEDITINIGKDAEVPVCPMPGHKWKEVRHDNSVSWLAFWNDPINTKESKYVFLHQTSSLKAQSDKEKYEKARKLKDYIEAIRKEYTRDFSDKDATKRQIAVATYLIDRLALRAGNEKDDDEADTVGCCSLKVEHVANIPPTSLEFDFLGKDSIRYYNTVPVDKRVYTAIQDFRKGKKEGTDLFDKLDTSKLNAHLKSFMQGLTAKVFRTYNASITLDNQLEHTVGSNVNEKAADYLRANKQVAILCNHQRSVSKTHGAQMERLEGKMAELKALREEIEKDLERAKKGKPPLKDKEGKTKRNQSPEQLQKKLDQTDKKIEKMELDMKTKDDMKTVALGTSKINYMDPRITVAWCKRNEVPIEKVFNKSLLGKFAWAMDVEPDFKF